MRLPKKKTWIPTKEKLVQAGQFLLKRVLFKHGEKFIAVIIILIAIKLVLQTQNYQPLPWKPDALDQLANETEKTIQNNPDHTHKGRNRAFNYAEYAQQIKNDIPLAPYQDGAAWKPVLQPELPLRGGFEILTIQTLIGKPARSSHPTAVRWTPPNFSESNSSVKGRLAQTGINEVRDIAAQEQQSTPQTPADQESIKLLPAVRNPSDLSQIELGSSGLEDMKNSTPLWVNLFGTIPTEEQNEIYHHVFDQVVAAHRSPKYVFSEWERATVDLNNVEYNWKPLLFKPNRIIAPPSESPVRELPADQEHVKQTLEEQSFHTDSNLAENQSTESRSAENYPIQNNPLPDYYSQGRLIPFHDQHYQQQRLLFSDESVEPAKTYAYRVRLYLANPNFNMQESSVEEDVDTKSPYILSDWSIPIRVYVPEQTEVRLHSVSSNTYEFPRQSSPLSAVRGTVWLDYFDLELAQSLPLVEKRNLLRGALCNMSKDDANRYINRGRTHEEFVSINYPDMGLRSNVCVADFSGGKKLQKLLTREAQASPDLSTTGKALLIMPDGTMQTFTTAPSLFSK